MKKPVVLVVMDGIGCLETDSGNAVKNAYTPHLNLYKEKYPWTEISAHGLAVGLPSDDDMGNSEVGHNALGCGQIYSQGAKLVNESIANGSMFKSNCWNELVENVKFHNSTFHFIGLLSDGNVHSNTAHLFAMIKELKKSGVNRVRAHVLLDGRDVSAQSCLEYISALELLFAELNDDVFDGKIASGGGRMKITMDRYGADWNMVKLGWDTHVLGKGVQVKSASDAVLLAREKMPNIIDQDLPAFVVAEGGEPVGKILDNDSVVLFNFRGDRALELTMAFDNEDFNKFDREFAPKVIYAGMLQYDGDLQLPKNYLVSPPSIKNTLSEFLVERKISQYAVSETQKFGHVTYFWNGNRSEKFSDSLETFYEIASDSVSFDERPWMKCAEITDKLIEAMESKEYEFIRCNFPNGDMVGHTGNYQATKIAVESVDLCIGRIVRTAKNFGFTVILTADHGNAEEMKEKTKNGTKSPKTAHTLNPVPFIIIEDKGKHVIKNGKFGLANIASTVVKMLGFEPMSIWEESIIE